MEQPTEVERDRAHRLGVIAGRARRRGCPYNVRGSAAEKQLAAVYVRAFIDAGGDLGQGERKAGGGKAGGNFGHIGMPV